MGPPEDPEAVDRAAASIDRYDWVVFESAVSAARFLTALMRGPRDLRALGAHGDLRGRRRRPRNSSPRAASKPTSSSRSCAWRASRDAMVEHAPINGTLRCWSSGPITNATCSQARSRTRGASVTDLVAYRTDAEPPDSPAAQAIYRMLLDGKIDAVTFASPTAVQRFAALIGAEQAVDLLNTTVVAAIGPVTAAAAPDGHHADDRRRSLTPSTAWSRRMVKHFAH